MDEKDSDFINVHLRKFAENIGVPSNLLDRPNGSAKWEGRFDAVINGSMMPMVLRPVTIEIQSNPPMTLICTGDETVSTKLGELFHASYSSSSLLAIRTAHNAGLTPEGSFQLFRFKDPIKRGKIKEYAFTQIFNDGNKHMTPVTINFRDLQ
jgi:hypothetical protein